MAFDLGARKPKDEVLVSVADPVDGSATGATITLAGRYSPTARAATFALAEKADIGNPDSPAAFDAKLLDLLAACTMDWAEMVEHGEPLACTPENAKRVYIEYPWLREQVQVAFLASADFFGDAATRS
jgi:hypothetical protein